MTVLKIILGLLKALLIAVGIMIAAAALLLCVPVLVHIVYDSTSGGFELEIEYLFIPLRILPKDERSVLTRLERLSGSIKEFKEKTGIKIRNRMLMYRPTRWLYRKAERSAERRRARKLAKKLEKLKMKKRKEQSGPKKKEKSTFGRLLEERGVGGMISWIIELARIACGMLGKIFRGFIIKQLDLFIAAGGEDAAQAAINHGRLCAAVLPAVSVVLGRVRRYRRHIEIRPDFENESIRVFFETRFTVIPIAVIGHALMAVLKMIFGEIKRQISERMVKAT